MIFEKTHKKTKNAHISLKRQKEDKETKREIPSTYYIILQTNQQNT